MNTVDIHMERTDFTGGDTVKGTAVVSVMKPILVRGIRIHFTGYEKSYWTTGSGKNRTTHSQQINYFDEEFTVHGNPPLSFTAVMADAIKGLFCKEHYEELAPGKYEYPFSYQLPQGLPADFDNGTSRIAYQVRTYVDIPLKTDTSCTQPLTVYEHYNEDEIQPVVAGGSRSFLLDSSPISAEISLDRNMYFPGERITGTLQVHNDSSKTIDEIAIRLKKQVDLRAHSSKTHREESIPLGVHANPRIPQGSTQTFPIDVVIPSDLYCTIDSSQIVKLSYELECNLDIPWAIDLKVGVPIRILEEAGMPSGISLE